MASIQFFCTRWGSEHLAWKSFCSKVKSAGYDGVEYGISATTSDSELDEVYDIMQKLGLQIIPQHYDTSAADFSQHLEQYQEWLERIAPYPNTFINSQTGKDFFDFDQNTRLINLGNDFNVLHETHRGKFSFAAHITKAYLQAIPGLRLTLDISHWVCVAESLLTNQRESVDIAINRTDHIHARVGFPEGPQVSDPRIPEYADFLNSHLAVWDRVVNLKSSQNLPLTITAEFGPYPYMTLNPITSHPIADQWSINIFMMEMLKKRYL